MKRLFALWCCLLLVISCIGGAGAETKDVPVSWYEVFVRSYADSNGDGLGDLNGLRAKLPYIHDMGWRGLWLMPIMPSPSYHKYDVTDYRDIDPEYGTMEDFRALVSEAHALDIRVIVDLPVNHTAVAHPWFKEACDALRQRSADSEKTGWYCFSQTPGSKHVPVEGTDWYYEEQFAGGGMPDLNLDSESLRAEIRDILAFWLTDVGVDGFRLDAVTSYYTGHNDQNIAFLAWLKESCEAIKPGSFLVGECWTGLNTIVEYYDSGVDCFFLFPASQAEGWVCKALLARSKPAERFAASLQSLYEALPDALYAPFLCNHDTGRTVPALQARTLPDRVKLAHALVSVIGGAAFTYYGDEIGMVGAGEDPNKRLAMYWSDEEMTEQPPGVTKIEYAYPSVAEQEADEASLLHYIKRLNQMKLAWPEAFMGRAEIRSAFGNVLALARETADGPCLIVANLSLKQTEVFEINQKQTIFCDLETGANTALLEDDGRLTLPPGAVVLLRSGD
ncbi:MAG: alpha amylase [Clostridia bacterium]|nr:alpha amylase [Clostridia bacterium]